MREPIVDGPDRVVEILGIAIGLGHRYIRAQLMLFDVQAGNHPEMLEHFEDGCFAFCRESTTGIFKMSYLHVLDILESPWAIPSAARKRSRLVAQQVPPGAAHDGNGMKNFRGTNRWIPVTYA